MNLVLPLLASLLLVSCACAAPAGARAYSLPCGAGICPTTSSPSRSANEWARWMLAKRVNRVDSELRDPLEMTGSCRRRSGRLRYRCTVNVPPADLSRWTATVLVQLPAYRRCEGKFSIRATRISVDGGSRASFTWKGRFNQCEI